MKTNPAILEEYGRFKKLLMESGQPKGKGEVILKEVHSEPTDMVFISSSHGPMKEVVRVKGTVDDDPTTKDTLTWSHEKLPPEDPLTPFGWQTKVQYQEYQQKKLLGLMTGKLVIAREVFLPLASRVTVVDAKTGEVLKEEVREKMKGMGDLDLTDEQKEILKEWKIAVN